LTLDFLAVIIRKSYKKVYIFCSTNIPKAIVLSPALAFDAFEAKSIRQPPDIDQSSFQTVCSGIIRLAITLLSAGTVFLIWRASPQN